MNALNCFARSFNLVLLFVFFFAFYSNATDYYVNDAAFNESGSLCSVAGAAGNTGLSTSSPKATIAQILALGSIRSTDKIYVDVGTYTTESELLSGNSDDYGFTIEGVLVSGIPVSVFNYGGGNAHFLNLTRGESDNVTIKNLYVQGYKPTGGTSYGGFLLNTASTGGDSNASGWIIQDCVIDDCDAVTSGGAIYWNDLGTYTISGTTFKNCNAASGGAILSIQTVTLTKCIFTANTTSADGIAIYLSTTSNTNTFTNCLFYANTGGNSNGTIYLSANSQTLYMYNCTLAYNTTANSATYYGGLYNNVSSSSTFTYAYNCVGYGNDKSDFHSTSTSKLYMYYSCYNVSNASGATTGSLSATNPLFINSGANNYHLSSTSPCINTGTGTPGSGSYPNDDLDGDTRTGLIDMGCYEFDCTTTYQGTYYVGTTGTWTTLTSALSALKSCMIDDVILELEDSYRTTQEASETYPLNFIGLPTSSTVTLTIRPKSDVASTITLDGGSSTTIIDFDATNYVTIDGRPGGTGSTSRLAIKNTTAAAASKRALIIQNNSSNNTVRYCSLLANNSSTTNSTAGVVLFGDGASGNSNNTIDNCTITYASTATACLIVSYNSSASTANTSNIISNNTLKDFTNHGIWCDTKSTSFTISTNQIYQTAASYSTSTVGTYLVYVTAGTGYTINGNYIGGSGLNCDGTDYFTVNANGNIYGINFGGTGAGTNNIYNNTIKYLKSNSTTATSVAVGIYLNNPTATTLNIYGNTISFIKAGSSSTAAVHYSAGMLSTGTCSTVSLSVYKNTVKSIENAMGSSSSAYLYGIDFGSSTAASTNYYYNNYINLDYGSDAARIYGISTGASSVVYNNTIYAYSGSQQTYDRYCLKIIGSVNNTVKNNLFINVSSGTSGNTKFSSDIFVNGTGGTQTHSYNYYQFTGTYSSSVNNNGTATSWTGETGGQTNTDVSLNANGRATPSASRIADLGTDLRAASPAISEDITSGGRVDASPWIGCYEGNAPFYWVGGTGNWSDFSNHWSTSSGGSPDQSNAPTATDNVYFDANSSAGTCTIDAAATCLDFTGTGFTGTIAGTFGLTISGNLVVGSAMAWSHSGTTTFNATSTGKTITSNAISIACPIDFNGSGGGWTLQDVLTTTNSITFTLGTLTTGGYNMNVGSSWTNNGGTFTHGSNTVTFTGAGTIGGTSSSTFYNLTKSTAGTSTLGIAQTVSNDLTISAGTLSASSFNLTIGGNWVNDGTFNAGTGRVTFNGSSNKTVTGSSSTAFYELEVDKGTSITSVLEITVPASITYNCVFTDGLLKLSHASITASDVVSATTDISATSGLHINGATYSTSSNAVLNNSGYFRVTSGSATVGTASDNTLYNESATSVFILDGGTVDCYGRFRSAAGSVTISSGTLTIGTGSIDNIATRGGFEIETGSDFSMTGGTVVLKARNPNASGNDLYIVSGGTKTITGGTFQIGNASTVASRIFKINSDISLYNLTIFATNSPTAILQQNTTVVHDFSNDGIFDANVSGPYNLTIGGAFTNNGTFTARTGTTIFNGSTAQSISGVTDPVFYNLTMNNSSTGVSLGLNTSITNTLTLTAGLLKTVSYTLSLGVSGSSDGTISGGGSGSYIVAYDNSGTIGYFKRFTTSTGVTYALPIGDATNYLPVNLNYASATLSNAYLTAYTKASKVTGLSSSITNYINRSWEVTPTGASSYTYTIDYTFVTGDVVGSKVGMLPIKLSGSTWYKPTSTLFTTGTAQGSGSFDGAFKLTWSGLTTFSLFGGAVDQSVALPIELLTFDVKPYNNNVKLNWKTASEINNDYFLVERSTDGNTFKTIAKVDGAGNSTHLISYYLIDQEFEKTINYYRLIQTDFNGSQTNSEVLSIDMTKYEGVIVMTVNTLGQEVNQSYSGVVFDIYSDGSSVKRIQ